MLNPTATQKQPLNKKGSLENGCQKLASLPDRWASDGAGHGGRDVPVLPAASPLAGLPAVVPGERAGAEVTWGQAGARRGELCRHRPYGFWSFSTKVFWGGGCFISRFFWKGFGLISSSAKH